MRSSNRLILTVVVVLGAGVLAPAKLMADPFSGNCLPSTDPGGSVFVSFSCSETQVVQTSYATNFVSAYETTVTAELGSGPFLFDASFNLPYSDPVVQAAVLQAEEDLFSAGVASYSGPTLVSNTNSTSSSVSTVMSNPLYDGNFVTGSTITFGPGVIFTGDLGLCHGLAPGSNGGFVPIGCGGQASLLSIPAGQTNININTNREFSVNQVTTTTNTTLTSQTYNLAGVGTVPPVPEPASICLLGTGILAMVGAARRRLPGMGSSSTTSSR